MLHGGNYRFNHYRYNFPNGWLLQVALAEFRWHTLIYTFTHLPLKELSLRVIFSLYS